VVVTDNGHGVEMYPFHSLSEKVSEEITYLFKVIININCCTKILSIQKLYCLLLLLLIAGVASFLLHEVTVICLFHHYCECTICSFIFFFVPLILREGHISSLLLFLALFAFKSCRFVQVAFCWN